MAICRTQLRPEQVYKKETSITSSVSVQHSPTLRQLREEERMTQVCWREEHKEEEEEEEKEEDKKEGSRRK